MIKIAIQRSSKFLEVPSEGRVLVARDNRLGTINVEKASVLVDASIAFDDHGILIGGAVRELFKGTPWGAGEFT